MLKNNRSNKKLKSVLSPVVVLAAAAVVIVLVNNFSAHTLHTPRPKISGSPTDKLV